MQYRQLIKKTRKALSRNNVVDRDQALYVLAECQQFLGYGNGIRDYLDSKWGDNTDELIGVDMSVIDEQMSRIDVTHRGGGVVPNRLADMYTENIIDYTGEYNDVNI
jgi:hypothetical protein